MKQPKDSSPGPWFVTAGIAQGALGRLIVQDRDENPVCATSARGVQGRTEAMAANAALIAAAPDMFAALIAALEWIEDDRFADDYIMEEWYHDAVAAVRMAGYPWPRKDGNGLEIVCSNVDCLKPGCHLRCKTRLRVDIGPSSRQMSILDMACSLFRAAGPQAAVP